MSVVTGTREVLWGDLNWCRASLRMWWFSWALRMKMKMVLGSPGQEVGRTGEREWAPLAAQVDHPSGWRAGSRAKKEAKG